MNSEDRNKRIEEIRQRQEHRTGVSYWECQSEIKFLLEEIKLLNLQSDAVIEHNARLLADACQLREKVFQLRGKRDSLQVERDKAVEWLKGAVVELDRLGAEAWNKWEKDADMLAQGEAGAYDTAEQMVEAILSELGESHDPLD